MTDDAQTLWSWRVSRLRQSFDEAFALPAESARAGGVAVLLVTAGGTRCAIPLTDCAGIVPSATVVTAPSRVRGFLGFTSAGGVVRPVYALAEWLELASSPQVRPPLLLAGAHAVALAVESIEGQAAVEETEITAEMRRVVSIGGRPARLVGLQSVLDAIAREARDNTEQTIGER